MARNKQPMPVLGAASLLVMFAVLCMTVFAMLSLTTAQAFRRLSDASVRSVENYYQADLLAETIYAQLRSGELPEGVTQEDNRFFFSCPVSETQMLEVTLQTDGDSWQVLQWQTKSIAQWKPDNSLKVWDGSQ